jgi:uncharacterized surface protein with fasciclin (FAS1) repeats
MFLSQRFKILIVALSVIAGFITCTKKWDEHNQVTDSALNNTLMQAIAGTPNLSKFADLLVKSGYDKIISSSKTFTVWAPTDQALQSLDPSIVNDSAKLRQFVGNHITNQSYTTGSAGDQRLKMLNGKYIVTNSTKFDSANIITTNAYANNGVIHTIDKFIPRLDNTWEFVNNNTSLAPAMRSFLLSLNHIVFDPSKATQTGVNPNTGEPIYDTASGATIRNSFLDSVMDVSDETNQYTLILLTDNAYSTEFNKLTPWFKTGSTDSTNRFAGYWLVKDLVFKGAYSAAQLPDTIVSQYGVKVPINKSAITASYRTSNGIVHVMSQVNFNLAYKFPPIIIQGENPTSFAADRSANTFYRVRYNPVTGQNFNDILLQNYGYASYWIRYFLKNIPSMRYNAYWVAVNDVQTTPLWQQRLGIDSTNNTTNLPYVTMTYKNYNEVSLGQFTINKFKNVNLYVIGPTTSSTSGGSNSIVLDYIKLVPAF